MVATNERIIGYSNQVLGENPNLRFSLGVTSGEELAEKLAFGSARQAIQMAEQAGMGQDIDNLRRAVSKGNLDEVVGYAEGVYKAINPEAQQSLTGIVFNSLLNNQQISQQ